MAGGGDANQVSVPLIVSGLVGALNAVIAFFAVRLHNRVDELEKQALEDAKVRVTREELQAYTQAATSERRVMHKENQELLKQIFSKLDDHSQLKEKVRRAEADIKDIEHKMDRIRQIPGSGHA